MSTRVDRKTVDLSGYPELVVVYLGMRVNRLTGMKTLLGFGPQISDSVAARPDGIAATREYGLFAIPSPRGDAPILERFRFAFEVDAFRSTQGLVEKIFEGLRRDGILA